MEDKEETVWATRKPAVAGQFYPGNPGQLSSMIDEFLNQVDVYEANKPLGIIAPHAGYIYSGPTAAYAYKQLQGRSYKTVIVLAPSHFTPFNGASIPNVSHYETPLGLIPLSPKAVDLMEEKIVQNVAAAHAREHSLEVHLPFLQKMLGEFELIPIVIGNINPEEFAEKLVPYIDDDTLVVASTDLSHYQPYETAKNLDTKCVEDILSSDTEKVAGDELCGMMPVLTLMHVAIKRGWTQTLMDYRTSGDTAGDKGQVVGYASIVFHNGLNKDEQGFLLKLARETVEKHVRYNEKPEVDESKLTNRLRKEQACFVTYNKHGQLRGCIGHLEARKPLYECVIENAMNAAVNDPRFNQVTESELPDIEIEVSALTTPEELEYSNPEELLEKLTPLRDGVIIQTDQHSSTYLPQVWEQLPDKKQFLTQLCQKGGSSGDCWKNKDTKIKTYQAQVFSE